MFACACTWMNCSARLESTYLLFDRLNKEQTFQYLILVQCSTLNITLYIYSMSLNYKYTCIVHEGALSFQNIPQLLIFGTCTFWIVEIAKVYSTLSQRRKNIRHARKIVIVSEILRPHSMAIGTFFRRFFLSHGLIQRLFIFTPVWGVGGKTPGIGENVLS